MSKGERHKFKVYPNKKTKTVGISKKSITFAAG
jgi:hypothetical protein